MLPTMQASVKNRKEEINKQRMTDKKMNYDETQKRGITKDALQKFIVF